jgi:peptidoglycan hydrolase-like protein with peptidoglycan-binding domain
MGRASKPQDLRIKTASTRELYHAAKRGARHRTQRVVKAFQQRHGLTADGEVGPRTWAKLF